MYFLYLLYFWSFWSGLVWSCLVWSGLVWSNLKNICSYLENLWVRTTKQQNNPTNNSLNIKSSRFWRNMEFGKNGLSLWWLSFQNVKSMKISHGFMKPKKTPFLYSNGPFSMMRLYSLPIHAKDIPKICPRYPQDMVGIGKSGVWQYGLVRFVEPCSNKKPEASYIGCPNCQHLWRTL